MSDIHYGEEEYHHGQHENCAACLEARVEDLELHLLHILRWLYRHLAPDDQMHQIKSVLQDREWQAIERARVKEEVKDD